MGKVSNPRVDRTSISGKNPLPVLSLKPNIIIGTSQDGTVDSVMGSIEKIREDPSFREDFGEEVFFLLI